MPLISPPTKRKSLNQDLVQNGFLTYALVIPLWIALGVFVGAKSHTFLSKANPDVYLAELLISNPEIKNDKDNIDVQTFLSSGKTLETLVKEAEVIREKFYIGSMIAGGFMGLVIGMTLLNTVVFPQASGLRTTSRQLPELCPVYELLPGGEVNNAWMLKCMNAWMGVAVSNRNFESGWLIKFWK